ncbi:hypothetical protein PG995_005217 [Apiospora arundinis]
MLFQRCRRMASQATNQLVTAATRTTQLATHRVPAITRFNASRLTAFRQSSLIHAWMYSTSPDASAPATPASPSALNALEKPDSLDEAESSIWDKLTAEFAPIALQVMDVSGGCGSMPLR